MKQSYLLGNIIKIILLIAAIACIITGIFNGGYLECVHKSIGICWECIGLG